MKKLVLGGLAAVLVVGVSASAAHSACDFPHSRTANRIQASLVESFVSCGNVGGNTPNTTTEGGVGACTPPETYYTQSGNSVTGWRFGLHGHGYVRVRARTRAPVGTVPADSTDVSIQGRLWDVEDANGPVGSNASPANGAVSTLTRATFDDRTNGSLTVTDFPANIPIALINGNGSVQASADLTVLAPLSQPGLPHCTSLETVAITVTDVNGDQFANMGVFMR